MPILRCKAGCRGFLAGLLSVRANIFPVNTLHGMTFKKKLKTGIKLVIEADGNITTLVIRLSKAQLIAALDYLIPDDVETRPAK